MFYGVDYRDFTRPVDNWLKCWQERGSPIIYLAVAYLVFFLRDLLFLSLVLLCYNGLHIYEDALWTSACHKCAGNGIIEGAANSLYRRCVGGAAPWKASFGMYLDVLFALLLMFY